MPMQTKNVFSLKKKVSVVTGGLGLLGTAIVNALAESGAKVVILDVERKKWKKASKDFARKNLDVCYENFDITALEGIKVNIKRLERKYGNIDIWVNNAYPRTKDWGNKLEKVKAKSWRRNVDMQLNSYCLCSNEIATRMAARRRGSIINISSIYGVVAPDFDIYKGTKITAPAAYSAVKGGIVAGGIVAYSKYLASYYKNKGVRINVVCPGGAYNNQSGRFVKRYSAKTLLGRMAYPYEIGWPVVFLASEAASYITGATLMIDGGLTTI
jgi:NAD(P)-dependent dehydrogenase (short-subunit alcohol dehydrogenase family)